MHTHSCAVLSACACSKQLAACCCHKCLMSRLWNQLQSKVDDVRQWGTLDYHKQSLNNLTEAMRKTRKLCAVMVDTIGRELIINREARLDERGWPVHEGQPIAVAAGNKVC